jgi:hypothetical protein
LLPWLDAPVVRDAWGSRAPHLLPIIVDHRPVSGRLDLQPVRGSLDVQVQLLARWGPPAGPMVNQARDQVGCLSATLIVGSFESLLQLGQHLPEEARGGLDIRLREDALTTVPVHGYPFLVLTATPVELG